MSSPHMPGCGTMKAQAGAVIFRGSVLHYGRPSVTPCAGNGAGRWMMIRSSPRYFRFRHRRERLLNPHEPTGIEIG
jgi:hypothetical protein